jgi:hypothetical protein
MKDIDFDELDKAVNSLMASVSPASPAGTPPQESPQSNPQPAVPVASAPEPTTPMPPASPAPVINLPAEPQTEPVVAAPAEPTSVPVTPAARPAAPAARRGGRFMDMEHTSSDMTSRAAAPAVPSREGITLTPPSETPQPAAPAPIINAPTDAPLTPEPADTVMPDPLDLNPFGQPESLGTSGLSIETPAEPAAAAEPVELTEPTATLAPAESPFLADAKVEKRPLNSNPSGEPPLDLMAEFEPAQPVEPTEPTEPADTGRDDPPAFPQVPELSSDLVAIESDEKIDVTQATETETAAAEVAQPAVPLGAASIPQQYTAQESSGDKSHAAIYDASQYPEPVSHPAKHKSSWLWVLWIVLLLAAGAGGAFLLYSLGLLT